MERYSSEETKLERIEIDVNVRNSAVEASAALKQGFTEAKNSDCRIIPQRRRTDEKPRFIEWRRKRYG